jgi:outer membrane lipoprotein SlyB
MKKISLIIAASVLTLSGCGNMPMNNGQPQSYQGYQSNQYNQNVHYGKLMNVREYGMQRNDSNGVAMAGGAVVGGLLGHQVGGGRGKTLATIAGAGLGAYAANEVTKSPQVVPMVELQIRDDNGTSYTISQEKKANFYPGQRVRVVMNGNVGTVTPY